MLRWAEYAPKPQWAAVAEELQLHGYFALAEKLHPVQPSATPGVPQGPAEAAATGNRTATDLLWALTGAAGADAFETVEQGFRSSISRFGARFVAKRARAAIDETMGPMHSTVVVSDLLAALEQLDQEYLAALTNTLETMHDWHVVAERSAVEKKDKSRSRRRRTTSSLSSPKSRS